MFACRLPPGSDQLHCIWVGGSMLGRKFLFLLSALAVVLFANLSHSGNLPNIIQITLRSLHRSRDTVGLGAAAATVGGELSSLPFIYCYRRTYLDFLKRSAPQYISLSHAGLGQFLALITPQHWRALLASYCSNFSRPSVTATHRPTCLLAHFFRPQLDVTLLIFKLSHLALCVNCERFFTLYLGPQQIDRGLPNVFCLQSRLCGQQKSAYLVSAFIN